MIKKTPSNASVLLVFVLFISWKQVLQGLQERVKRVAHVCRTISRLCINNVWQYMTLSYP